MKIFKKLGVCLLLICACQTGLSASFDETKNNIITNLEKLIKKNPENQMIQDSLTLTNRLLNTHESSYLKKETQLGSSKQLTQEVYYSNDEFLSINYKDDSNLTEYNLYHQNGWIYQWNQGESVGVKYPVRTSDLVNYVGYSVNPLGLISTYYEDYLEYPGTFNVTKNENEPWSELEFTVRRYAYKALLVDLENTWFYGVKILNTQTNRISTLWIHPPQEYEQLPQDRLEAFKHVEFTEDKTQSLKQYMKYITVVPGNNKE